MTQAESAQVANVSGFKVRGNQVSATFDVVVAPLKWTEDQAVVFEDALNERHPDLYCYALRYVTSADDGPVLSPTTLERLSIRWIGGLHGPVQREKVEAEFASRRHVVLSMLADYSGKQSVE